MHFKTYWVFCALMTIGNFVMAQKVIHHSSQQWIQYYTQIKVSQRWSINADAGFRWKDGNKLQYIGRTGINYQVNSKLRIGGGVATTGSYQGENLSKVEFRPYQEIFAPINDKKVAITSRFRMEERFFKNRLEIPVTHEFNFRFRYQLSFSIPIATLSKRDDSKQLSLTLSDEIFINAGKDIVYNALDRNRLLIGPSISISRQMMVSASYMYQFAQKNSAAQYDSDNVLWFTVRHNLNLVKAKKE